MAGQRQALFSGIVGGVIGALAISGGWVWALTTDGKFKTIFADRVQIEDKNGQRVIDLAPLSNGGSALFVFDRDGRSRLEAGTYADGLPFVALESDDRTVRALLRLAGPNQAGMLVFKDKNNRDRLILGLNPDRPDEEPFLVSIDPAGNRRLIFGHY
jgi:hypothetical protein